MSQLRFPTRSPSGGDAMVPMVNIAFLLMAFFMLIGRMDATAPFSVLPPTAAIGADLPQGGLTVSVSEGGKTALDGTAATRAQIVARLKKEPAAFVRINADGRVPLLQVLPLASLLEDAGAARVVLVVTPEPRSGP